MSSNDGKIESWEKTIRDGNMTKCIRVEKVENGYIVSYNEYGRKTEKSEYMDITKKWIGDTSDWLVQHTRAVLRNHAESHSLECCIE